MKRLVLAPLNIIVIIFIGSVIVNIFLAILIIRTKEQALNTDSSRHYPFLSKRIFAENQNDLLIHFVPLRTVLKEYISKQKEEIGLYFEYLPSGTSIGINEGMEVRFASLIKIPVVMAAYKQMEQNNFTKYNLVTVAQENINKGFGDLWKRGAGTQLTVAEAIRLSLVESDNTALRALVNILPQGAIEDVFDNLDIVVDSGQGYPIISPKNYTSILRSLYLASYLTRDDSNEILTMLTQTKFNDMLAAGVDPEVTIAHKIGVFDPLGIFSDCGIVYVPNRPYAICLMVKSDEITAKRHMSLLSKIIYGYISKVSMNP